MTADPWYGSDPLPGTRAGADPASSEEQVAAQAAQTALWNGHRIRLYAVQYRYWALIIGLIGATAVAGAYFGLWEVHWYLPFGPAWLRQGFTLNGWWHAGTWWPRWLGHWDLYRHIAFRNQLEPGIGCLLALSVMAHVKWWGVRVSAFSIGVRMVAVLAVTIGLGVLGVWLNFFGLPWLWARASSGAGHPGFNLHSQFAWAGKSSLFILAWGILVMGPVAHRIWAPAGATIQGFVLDRSADRARDRAREGGTEQIPLWVQHPVAPPGLRLRWSALFGLPDDGQTLTEGGWVKRAAIRLILAAFTWLVILGIIGHYVVGVFHLHVPYLAP